MHEWLWQHIVKRNYLFIYLFTYLIINYNIIVFLFLTDAPDRFCNSPLHWATKEDNQPILLALIRGGANVNAKGHIGKTPLHIAVSIWWKMKGLHFDCFLLAIETENKLAGVNYVLLGRPNFPRTNEDFAKPIPTVLLLCQRATYFCWFIAN